MTTIDTIDDLLRLVRENDEVRAALRREVLTEELLALPAQFIGMQETQTSMQESIVSLQETQNSILETIASMQESIVSLQETQNSILETIASMQESIVSLQETQNSILEEIREMRRDISALHGMFRQQHEDFGRFRGNYASDAVKNNRGEIARLFARQRNMRRRVRVRILGSEELSDMLDEHYDAVSDLSLRERSWETFYVPDMIVEVTERRSSEPGFYIAVEASYTGHEEDMLRAVDHANILRCATGQDAYAVVAGVRIGPSLQGKTIKDASHLVSLDNKEDDALWYQLVEQDLEPLDPT